MEETSIDKLNHKVKRFFEIKSSESSFQVGKQPLSMILEQDTSETREPIVTDLTIQGESGKLGSLSELDLLSDELNTNYKGKLNELCITLCLPPPSYTCVGQLIPNTGVVGFTTTLSIKDKVFTSMVAMKKSDSEKEVARAAVLYISSNFSRPDTNMSNVEHAVNRIQKWVQKEYYCILADLKLKDSKQMRFYLTNAVIHASFLAYLQLAPKVTKILSNFMDIDSIRLLDFMTGMEPLATLGDSVLKLLQTDRLYFEAEELGLAPQKSLTTVVRSGLENNMYLATKCEKSGITKYVIIAFGCNVGTGVVYATYLEALLGCAFKTEGLKAAKAVANILDVYC